MNCKPGDIAVCIKASAFNPSTQDMFVKVLYLAPVGRAWRLPSGFRHEALKLGGVPWWVCEASHELVVPTDIGVERRDRYLPIPDIYLRPIRDPGDDAVDTLSLRKPERDELRQLEKQE